MSTLRIVLAILAIGLFTWPAQARVEVKDAVLGFSFELPVGFAEAPVDRNAPGIAADDILECYTRPGPGRLPGTVVLVKRLHGTLGTSPSALPDRSTDARKLDLSDETWKSVKLQVTRLTESANGAALVIFNVQVPLSPEAVQISVSGPPNQERRNRGLIRTILASLQGNSTWEPGAAPVGQSPANAFRSASPSPRSTGVLTPSERGERMGYGIAAFLIFLAVVVGGGFAWYKHRVFHALATQPNWTQNMSAAQARLTGAVILLFSGLMYYWCVQIPLDDAAAGKSNISLSSKAVFMLPVVVGASLVLLINGNRRVQSPQLWHKAMGIAFFAILFIAGIALNIWLESKLKSIGYRM